MRGQPSGARCARRRWMRRTTTGNRAAADPPSAPCATLSEERPARRHARRRDPRSRASPRPRSRRRPRLLRPPPLTTAISPRSRRRRVRGPLRGFDESGLPLTTLREPVSKSQQEAQEPPRGTPKWAAATAARINTPYSWRAARRSTSAGKGEIKTGFSSSGGRDDGPAR